MNARVRKTACSHGTAETELDRLLGELSYPEAVEKAVRKKLLDPDIEEISSTAYSGEGFSFELCRRMPLTRLAVVTYLLLQKYYEYKAKGICDQIIFETFRDVSLRGGLYYERTGKAGISKEDTVWFRHIMNVNIFKIGVLQYQPFEMIYLDEETVGEAYMVFSRQQKEALPKGAAVINCHIQFRANLDPSEVSRSLSEAKEFFGNVFPQKQFRAFLCYSWLLYPEMVEKLPKQSRIRKFAQRFTVIGSCGDAEQALENLFEGGRRKAAVRMTALQKLAMDHLDCFGFSCGIIEI